MHTYRLSTYSPKPPSVWPRSALTGFSDEWGGYQWQEVCCLPWCGHTSSNVWLLCVNNRVNQSVWGCVWCVCVYMCISKIKKVNLSLIVFLSVCVCVVLSVCICCKRLFDCVCVCVCVYLRGHVPTPPEVCLSNLSRHTQPQPSPLVWPASPLTDSTAAAEQHYHVSCSLLPSTQNTSVSPDLSSHWYPQTQPWSMTSVDSHAAATDGHYLVENRTERKSTRLNYSKLNHTRQPSSAWPHTNYIHLTA